MEEKATLVFDDGCPVCSLGVRGAKSITTDDAIRYIGMHTEEGKKYIQKHALDMNSSAYLIGTRGDVQEKERMVVSVLNRGGFAGKMLSLPFRIPYISRFLYTMLAWVRFHTTATLRTYDSKES